MRFYKFCREVARPICFLLFPRKVYGAVNLPKDGAIIVCSNHISLVDPLFLGLQFKQPLHFISKKEACDAPVLGTFIRALGAFPVDREGKDLKAIRTCMAVLKDGNTLGIFPEGTRIIRGKKSLAKAGVALIAKRSKATLVMARIKPKKGRVKPFVKTEIYFAEPISYEKLCGDLDYNDASRKILDTIYSLGE